LIELPNPPENPDTEGELPLAVHEKTTGERLDCRLIFALPPEQTEKDAGLISKGLGVTVTWIVAEVVPVQPFAMGVTI
jgi:hypothetical protein